MVHLGIKITMNILANTTDFFGRGCSESLVGFDQGSLAVLPGVCSLKQLGAEKHVQELTSF